MSRKYNIRWTDSDNAEIRKAVKNFNAKISRLEKKLPDKKKNALPQRTSVRAIKELVSTRSDLRKELNSLRRFSEKGAEELVTLPNNEYNTTITKWQKNEMSRRAGIVNRKRTQRYKDVFDLQATSGGEELGYTVGERDTQISMGQIAKRELSKIEPFSPTMTRADAHYRFEGLKRENQDGYWEKKEKVLRENYINELQKNFHGEDVADVIEEIENLSFNEFYQKFLQETDPWEFVYPTNRDDPQYQSYVSHLKSTWKPKTRKGS